MILVTTLLTVMLCVFLPLWALEAVRRSQSMTLSAMYMVVALISGCAGFFSTFAYEYYPNSNTRVSGWPIPYIIHQRAGPDEP